MVACELLMPSFFACPKCRRALNVPEQYLDQWVRCAACGTAFMTKPSAALPVAVLVDENGEPISQSSVRQPPLSKTPIPVERADPVDRKPPLVSHGAEDESWEAPSGTTRRRISKWRSVHIGVTLVAISTAVLCLLTVVTTAVFFAPVDDPTGGATSVIAALILYAASCVLGVAGKVFCLDIPEKSGARDLAVANLILVVGSQFLVCIPFVGLLAALFTPTFVFLYFVQAIARFLKADDLEANIYNLIYFLGVTIATVFASAAVAFAIGAAMRGAVTEPPRFHLVPGIGTVVFVLWLSGLSMLVLAAWIWYIVVLLRVRNEIGRYIERNTKKAGARSL
jgi:hypothetical protein